jgi:hypothetical protein
MQRFNVIGLAVFMVIASHAEAGATSSAAIARRQLNDCMSKRMAATKTLSYNEATKICKERLGVPSDAPPTATQLGPQSPQMQPNIGASTLANSGRS